MITVYIAGPFRAADAWGVHKNVFDAAHLAFKVAEAGFAVICPHMMFELFDRTLSDKYWLAATQELELKCNAVLLVPGWEKSDGARAEVALARARGIWVFELIGELLEWARKDPDGITSASAANKAGRPSTPCESCQPSPPFDALVDEDWPKAGIKTNSPDELAELRKIKAAAEAIAAVVAKTIRNDTLEDAARITEQTGGIIEEHMSPRFACGQAAKHIRSAKGE
jgi:hypothetical protein